jgi:hypothetical protein
MPRHLVSTRSLPIGASTSDRSIGERLSRARMFLLLRERNYPRMCARVREARPSRRNAPGFPTPRAPRPAPAQRGVSGGIPVRARPRGELHVSRPFRAGFPPLLTLLTFLGMESKRCGCRSARRLHRNSRYVTDSQWPTTCIVISRPTGRCSTTTMRAHHDGH